jgi:hypothetical protein
MQRGGSPVRAAILAEGQSERRLLMRAAKCLSHLVSDDPQGRTYAQAIADKLATLALAGDIRAASELAGSAALKDAYIAQPRLRFFWCQALVHQLPSRPPRRGLPREAQKLRSPHAHHQRRRGVQMRTVQKGHSTRPERHHCPDHSGRRRSSVCEREGSAGATPCYLHTRVRIRAPNAINIQSSTRMVLNIWMKTGMFCDRSSALRGQR